MHRLRFGEPRVACAGRPRGQCAVAGSEQAHTSIGRPLARQSERRAAPLDLGVAHRRGPMERALVREPAGGVPSEDPSAAVAERWPGREEASGFISGLRALHVVAGSPGSKSCSCVHHSGAVAHAPGLDVETGETGAASARGDANSAWTTWGSMTELYSSSTPIERDRLPAARHSGVVAARRSATHRV
jgi:hypothetical protein